LKVLVEGGDLERKSRGRDRVALKCSKSVQPMKQISEERKSAIGGKAIIPRCGE